MGANLIKLGAKPLFSMEHLSIMGIIEPLLKLPKLLYIRHKLFKTTLAMQPDLFIGVDAPEFNLGLEHKLRQHQIKTVHYVSPSVWAWRANRIHLIKAAVDLMLVLFPFELDFYKKFAVNAFCVGHPLADQISMNPDPKLAKNKLGFQNNDQILTIMPGSRDSELRHLIPIYLQTAKEIALRFPAIKFIIPVIHERHKQYIEKILTKFASNLAVKFIVQDSATAIQASDLVLVTSGTATLEVMLYKKPMIVAYKTNFITYGLIKNLIKVKYIALPNLLAGREIVKEFIQDQVTVYNLTNALIAIINQGGLITEQLHMFNNIHQDLQKNASKQAAMQICKLII